MGGNCFQALNNRQHRAVILERKETPGESHSHSGSLPEGTFPTTA